MLFPHCHCCHHCNDSLCVADSDPRTHQWNNCGMWLKTQSNRCTQSSMGLDHTWHASPEWSSFHFPFFADQSSSGSQFLNASSAVHKLSCLGLWWRLPTFCILPQDPLIHCLPHRSVRSSSALCLFGGGGISLVSIFGGRYGATALMMLEQLSLRHTQPRNSNDTTPSHSFFIVPNGGIVSLSQWTMIVESTISNLSTEMIDMEQPKRTKLLCSTATIVSIAWAIWMKKKRQTNEMTSVQYDNDDYCTMMMYSIEHCR